MHNNGYEIKLNLGIRQYAEAQEKITTNNPGQWQSLPEIPSSKEIALTDMGDVTVGANKIEGKWKSTDKYLRAHYELLREDSISPIRDAVDAVRKKPEMLDNSLAAIYEKVS
jgi:helicase required for RNAi-mediated heterochromatin assembly 1